MHLRFRLTVVPSQFTACCFSSAKSSEVLEELFNLFSEFCVEAHEEEGVDQTVEASKVDGARISVTIPLDRQVDEGRPPAEQEGKGEHREHEGHDDPIRLSLLRVLPHLAEDQPVADDDDQGWNPKNCHGRSFNPFITMDGEGAGGVVGDLPAVPIGEEGDGLDEA